MIVKSPEGIRLDGRMPLNMVEVDNMPNQEMVQMQRDLVTSSSRAPTLHVDNARQQRLSAAIASQCRFHSLR